MTFFCSLPWRAVDVGFAGQAKPCCKFKPAESHTVATYFDSAELRQVKQALLSGAVPGQCRQCQAEEAVSGHSLRIMTEQAHSCQDQIRQQAQSEQYSCISELAISTSNRCNLLCLPCTDGPSYARSRELQRMGLAKYTPQLLSNSLQVDQIPNLDQLESVTLLGGEPFADPETLRITDQLINSGHSGHIHLLLNTNLTLIQRETLEHLQANFQRVTIKASIDGTGQVNEYLRYPAQWSQIEQAVDLIQELALPLLIVTTISNLRLIRYNQVIAWAEARGIQDLFMAKVMYPAVLRFDRISPALQQQLEHRYTQLLAQYQGMDRTRFLIETCLEIVRGSAATPEQHAETRAWLARHDQHRGTCYQAIWPEFDQYE